MATRKPSDYIVTYEQPDGRFIDLDYDHEPIARRAANALRKDIRVGHIALYQRTGIWSWLDDEGTTHWDYEDTELVDDDF